MGKKKGRKKKTKIKRQRRDVSKQCKNQTRTAPPTKQRNEKNALFSVLVKLVKHVHMQLATFCLEKGGVLGYCW
jgi:hypothetical protein